MEVSADQNVIEFDASPHWRWLYTAVILLIFGSSFESLLENWLTGAWIALLVSLFIAWQATGRESLHFDDDALRIKRSNLGFKWEQAITWSDLSDAIPEAEVVGWYSFRGRYAAGPGYVRLVTVDGDVWLGPNLAEEDAAMLCDTIMRRRVSIAGEPRLVPAAQDRLESTFDRIIGS